VKSLRLCLVLIALSFSAGLAGAQPPAPATAPATPKVVVVSLDGAAAWLVEEMLARGVLPPNGALARLARDGARAQGMVPVTPSLTAAAHVAMFTGAYAERNGIVGNSLLLPGDPVSRTTSGFAAPIAAETLWQAAQRQGKRVACVTAVGADARAPERTCDWTLAYGRTRGESSVVELAQEKNRTLATTGFEHIRLLAATPASPAPLALRAGREEEIPLTAYAVDTVRDGREAYDAVLLRAPGKGANPPTRVATGKWAPLRVASSGGTAATWVKLLALAEDGSSARLYLNEVGENSGAPAEFVEAMESRLGPWPGDPDNRSLERGLIDERLWLEQAELLSRYLTGAAVAAMKEQEWDLFLTYLPLIDEVEHRFLLRAPRHPDYDAEEGARRARYSGYVDASYRLADQLLARLMEAAPPGTNFVVVSDHGMIPVHTQVLVNAALEQAGIRASSDDTAEVRAVTSSTTAHFYVNLEGRRPTGVVPAEKYEELVERIVAALSGLRDPVSGETVFEAVRRRSELGELHLDAGERAGDVWATCRPGFYASSRLEPGAAALQPAATFAAHGNLGSHRRMHAIFFAAGAQVKPGPLGAINGVDVAPTVAALLGIAPPADSQGRNVLAPAR